MKRHPIMEYVIPAIVASVATVLIRLVLGVVRIEEVKTNVPQNTVKI